MICPELPHGTEIPDPVPDPDPSSPSSSSSSSSSSSPWKSLPSDILERSLALLPLPAIFRARLVCKRWNSLIHCLQFRASTSKCTVSWGPFFAARVGWNHGTHHGSECAWAAYDLLDRKWVTMPALAFPRSPAMAARRCTGWNLMAASGGLLCFGASNGRGILVCNPMTRRWRELADVRVQSRGVGLTCMVVDEEQRSYKIIFAGYPACKQSDAATPTPNLINAYDSHANTWHLSEPLSPQIHLRTGAYSNGNFYLLARHSHTRLYGIYLLDLKNGFQWRNKATPIPAPQGFGNYPHLVSYHGRIFLVGASSEATDRVPMASIGIFELKTLGGGDDGGSTKCSSMGEHLRGHDLGDFCLQKYVWEKVCESEDEMFLRSTGAIYGCGASGGKIYVVTYAYDMWVAVYDLRRGGWEEPIKGNFFDMKDVFSTTFGFEPNLRVVP